MSGAAGPTLAAPVRREVDGGVMRLTVDNEARLNALTGAGMQALVDALEDTADDRVRVVVITGQGRAFCSGADLTDIGGADADPVAIMAGAERLVSAILRAPVPVIARVNGPAVGIGMSIALAADLAYVGPNAYLLQSFLSIGLMPDGGSTALLSAAMGRARANEAILLGRRISAGEAAESGLVAGSATSLEVLDDLVEAAVQRCAMAPRRAVELTKRALQSASLPSLQEVFAREAEGQVELLQSTEFAERSAALLSRRRDT